MIFVNCAPEKRTVSLIVIFTFDGGARGASDGHVAADIIIILIVFIFWTEFPEKCQN